MQFAWYRFTDKNIEWRGAAKSRDTDGPFPYLSLLSPPDMHTHPPRVFERSTTDIIVRLNGFSGKSFLQAFSINSNDAAIVLADDLC